ncbi:midcut-by-XrtH protein [Pseudazoarcus pumilus]|uniref:Midcut-by-XrtH protein n=1 Tax=Pseudazoarcus pumilus TaxID=2067960 RepID=A0A2I6S7T8_9RHOO|nr:hypothetical protein C0099_10580 [Pseudazoarcus pumilus]
MRSEEMGHEGRVVSRRLLSANACIAMSIASVDAFAQQDVDGSLTYNAAAATPIPSLGVIATVILALGLALAGFLAMRRNRSRTAFFLLLPGGGTLLVPAMPIVERAYAIAYFQLNQPSGGTIALPAGSQGFENSSGTTLRIVDIVPPSCSGGALATPDPAPLNACNVGLQLTDSQVCSTNYPGCAGQCVPDCSGKSCGSDGCGGSCGSCGGGSTCSEPAGICLPPP